VPSDDKGAELTVEATVVEKLRPPLVRLNVSVLLDGKKVLVMPRTILALR
jgi:hypothetical protein